MLSICCYTDTNRLHAYNIEHSYLIMLFHLFIFLKYNWSHCGHPWRMTCKWMQNIVRLNSVDIWFICFLSFFDLINWRYLSLVKFLGWYVVFIFQYTDEEVERCYEEFYEDVHTEFLKFGEIVNFKVANCSSCPTNVVYNLLSSWLINWSNIQLAFLFWTLCYRLFFSWFCLISTVKI